MSRGQTTAVIVVALAVVAVITRRACTDDDPAKPRPTPRVDGGSARAVPRSEPRVVRVPVNASGDEGARDITFRALDVTGQPLAAPPTFGIVDGSLVVTPGSNAIVGATRLEVGDGELHDVDVVIASAAVVAQMSPDAYATPEVEDGEPAGAIAGVISIDGARAPDVTVELIQLATFGPGRPVTHDRPPGPIDDTRVPARRFVGTRGEVELDRLEPGSYLAIVHAPGRGAALVPATVAIGPPADISTELPPMAAIGGTVKNTVDDAPLAGAVLRLRVDGVVVRVTVSDARGVYLLDNVPVTGTADLELEAPGCAADPLAISLSPDRTTRVIAATCP